jgi:hypothetical protein
LIIRERITYNDVYDSFTGRARWLAIAEMIRLRKTR